MPRPCSGGSLFGLSCLNPCDHHRSFNANCSSRALPVLVIRPNRALVRPAARPPKFGWFNRLRTHCETVAGLAALTRSEPLETTLLPGDPRRTGIVFINLCRMQGRTENARTVPRHTAADQPQRERVINELLAKESVAQQACSWPVHALLL